jgi:hypothetical protein
VVSYKPTVALCLRVSHCDQDPNPSTQVLALGRYSIMNTEIPWRTDQLVGWIQPYVSENTVRTGGDIPFDLAHFAWLQALEAKIFHNPPGNVTPLHSIRDQVDQLRVAVSLYHHAISGYQNLPSRSTRDDVLEKQYQFFEALKNLLGERGTESRSDGMDQSECRRCSVGPYCMGSIERRSATVARHPSAEHGTRYSLCGFNEMV